MHAVLMPSAAHRWVNCPGSVQAEQQYPNDENEAAREGTAAHEIAAELIKQATVARELDWSHFEGKQAGNGVLFTEEMFDAAKVYADDVQQVMIKTGVFTPKIEQPVLIPRVHELNWGTPDCSIFSPSKAKLIKWDFKYGRKCVEARENWQLIDYSIGLLDEIENINGFVDQYITVEMRIVQPRAFHVDGPCRSWTIPASDLRSYANKLEHAAHESLLDNPPTRAGSWCENCKASADCMTLQRDTSAIEDRIDLLQLHNLPPEHMAIELSYLRKAKTLLDERLDALESQALEQIRNGVNVPGFGIGYGRGSLNWNKPDNEVIALGDLMGIELRKPEQPITPTQAKKLNVDEAVIKSYSDHQQGSARLVTEDETLASRVFSNN